jgi:hypothetical protein
MKATSQKEALYDSDFQCSSLRYSTQRAQTHGTEFLLLVAGIDNCVCVPRSDFLLVRGAHKPNPERPDN